MDVVVVVVESVPVCLICELVNDEDVKYRLYLKYGRLFQNLVKIGACCVVHCCSSRWLSVHRYLCRHRHMLM